MADNDIQIRCVQKLAAIVGATKPKAVVLDWWTLAQGLGESIPQLQSVTEDEWGIVNMPWVHAYMFGFESFPRTALGHPKFSDEIEIRFWAFYGWKLGTSAHNSEHVFSKHVKDVQNAISRASKFQTDPNDLGTGVMEVTGHSQWQVDRLGTYWFGKHRTHVAQGAIIASANLLLPPVTVLQP